MNPRLAHFYWFTRPGGGPAGYLYHLRRGLALFAPEAPIDVVTRSATDDRESPFTDNLRALERNRLRAFIRGRVPAELRRRIAYQRYFRRWAQGRLDADLCESLARYSAVVFHDLQAAAWYVRDGHKVLGQKVLIQVHAPVDSSTENAAELAGWYGAAEVWRQLCDRARTLELGTYQASDGIVVPCRAAVEAYFAGNDMQREAFQNLAFHEIPSGVALLPVARSVSEVKAGLPVKGARLVGYLGRYHAHKGFDIFLDLARAAHEHYGGRFAFVSAGVGWITPDPISNYADLGWVKADLGGLVNALDLVVAPNRYSFFDLAMLEAMSLAKPLVTSAHGGNRWIAGTSDGVVLVDRDDPLAYLDVLARIDREGSYDQLGRANARAFATHFTLEAFVERHVAFTRRLLG